MAGNSRRIQLLSSWGLRAIALSFSLSLSAQGHNAETAETQSNGFDGLTPMSPTVFNTNSVDLSEESRLRDYLLREAYLVDARSAYLGKQGKMFTIPTDDLSSTQRRLLSPYMRLEEEEARRDYAETVSGIVVSKGLPEYVLQLLGLQKLREGVRKIEKAVAVDVTLTEADSARESSEVWKFKTGLLPFQRSYRLGLGNHIFNWDAQAGFSSSKGDRVTTSLSARWGRFVQTNTYQFLTYTGYSALSFFVRPELSVSASLRREFRDDLFTPDTLLHSVGLNYVF